MEEEYVRYRHAGIREKLRISRKFTKFYLSQFRPITNLEASDWHTSRQQNMALTAGGALFFGLISLRMRRAKSGALETSGVSRENNLPLYMLNDIFAGLFGYAVGQFVAVDYIYK